MNIGPDVKNGAPDDAYSQTRNCGITLTIRGVAEGSHYTSLSCFSWRSIETAINETYARGQGSNSPKFEVFPRR